MDKGKSSLILRASICEKAHKFRLSLRKANKHFRKLSKVGEEEDQDSDEMQIDT